MSSKSAPGQLALRGGQAPGGGSSWALGPGEISEPLAAGHLEHLPGDPRRRIAQQERDDLRDILGLTDRPRANAWLMAGSISGIFVKASSAIRVLVVPGATLLTRIPRSANSFAQNAVTVCIAPFCAA